MKKSLPNWIALASCLLFFCIGIPAQSVVDSAKKLFDAGQFKDAETLVRAQIGKNSSDPALYYWLGKCAFELYDDDLAFNSAERAVELDPKNAEYHYFLGTASGYKAEHSNWFSGLSLARKTQHEFLTAVQLNPDKLEAQREANKPKLPTTTAGPELVPSLPTADVPKRSPAFENLIRMLGSNAAMVLGGYNDPRTGQPMIDPEAARELIDMLDALHEKTAGNLHPEDDNLLIDLLGKLKMTYLEVNQALAKQAQQAALGAKAKARP